MGGAASFVAPRYERVGRGACESCSGPYTLLNPPCSPCTRCGARLCRRCFTASCAVLTPCGVLALPFVPRAASTCDACGPESEREARFAAAVLPFLAAGALVTRIQPSLLGEASSQVLLSLVPRERALRFASMHLTPEGRPRDSGTVSLDDVAELRSGATAAAGAGLQRAVGGGGGGGGGVGSASLSLAPAAATSAVAAPPYAPALVLHLVSARNRTVFVCACPDERTFERWSGGLAEALALAKSKHSTLFPTAGARAAAAASATSAAAAAAAAGAAKSAELARRQAERDAFKERLGLGAGAAAPRPPGTNPAALGGAPPAVASTPAVSLSGEALEALGRPAAGRGVPASALGALAARREGGGLAPMPIAASSAAQAQAQAQAAQEAATAALARAANAIRGGFAAIRMSIEASVPPTR
jgi:hypothetical protein